MKLSVIIPNLNTPTIDQVLDALRQQTLSDGLFEVWVVGVDDLGLVHPSGNIHFSRSPIPLAPAAARNRGVELSTGDIIVFLDADCIPAKDWLEKLSSSFQDPSLQVLGGGVDFSSDNYWKLADNLSMFYEYLVMAPGGTRKQLPSLNLAMRIEVFNTSSGFDERYPRAAGEDADLTIRLRNTGYVLKFNPAISVTHSPPRANFTALWRHGYYQGMYSTKVDPRYSRLEGTSFILQSRTALVLLSPLIALFTTLRIISKPYIIKYWYTAPAIFLSKIAWCIGASKHPDWS